MREALSYMLLEYERYNTGKSILSKLNCVDEKGNELISGQVNSSPHIVSIGLKLVSETRTRDLGKIMENRVKRDGSLIYKKHVNEKNIFRKTNSWGIDYQVLSSLPDTATLEFKSPTKLYKISAPDARQHGSFLHFKNQGFEKQIFVPLSYWDIK